MRLTDDEVFRIVTRLPLPDTGQVLADLVQIITNVINAGIKAGGYCLNGARDDLNGCRSSGLPIGRDRVTGPLRRPCTQPCGDNSRKTGDEGDEEIHPFTPSP